MTDGALSWCSLSYGFDENPIAMNQTIKNFFSAIKAKWPYDSLSLSLFNRPRVPQQHKLPSAPLVILVTPVPVSPSINGSVFRVACEGDA